MAARAKMTREERAKQFMPFAALKGYPEALRRAEQLAEARTAQMEVPYDDIVCTPEEAEPEG